ncbi:MAG: cation transporter [Clostridia bacterium]|nr:cation transporter [Clostridia bacterium]MBQ6931574.1 cation transporter [Clostridia bacterium]
MTDLLIKVFIKDSKNISSPQVRAKYGMLSGFAGIAVNILLCAVKFAIGAITGSIAITGDAFNNLSDAASSVVSLFGFKLASKPADEEHPYGHGRLEYLCGMAVGVLILFMGFELVKSSISKIISPEKTAFSWVAVIVLAVSILGKIWLAVFNKKIGKTINSEAISAVATDSISDIVATTASIIALVLSNYFTLPFDGIFGVIVSGFVLFAGFGVFKSTVSPLLGQPPTEETVRAIEDKILSYDGILGVHDLIIHDYGPGRCFVSAHAEVSSLTDIMESHDLIDIIEQDITAEMGYSITIHMDPLVVNDETINTAKAMVTGIVTDIEPTLSIHDFRVVSGPHHTNLIFDLVIPFAVKTDSAVIIGQINRALEKLEKNYYAVITVDRSYH